VQSPIPPWNFGKVFTSPSLSESRIEPFAGLDSATLQSAAFVDLQPLLQRPLLLKATGALLSAWSAGLPLGP